jgi:hypothetical protein
MLCLDAERVAQRQSRATLASKDMMVAKSASFALGTPEGPSLLWEARGVLIQATYRTFWPQERREAIYDQVVSTMRRCPPRQRP